MAVFWYKRDKQLRTFLYCNEMNKLILKSLLSNKLFKKNEKIYFGLLFAKYTKKSSIAHYRRFCIMTGNSRSVFRRFKMVRHWCKFFASNGYVVGLRKASF
jgi:ribosomal protein S14